MVRLRRVEMKKAHLSFDPPIRLPEGQRTRFVHTDLARLEQRLFAGTASRGGDEVAPIASTTPAVTILELPDRRCEVDAAVAEIQRLAARPSRPCVIATSP